MHHTKHNKETSSSISSLIAILLLVAPFLVSAANVEAADRNSIVVFPPPDPNRVLPISGNACSEMSGFDKDFVKFLNRWDIPGGTVALMRKGKLVFSRGYGYANKEKNMPMQPDSIFRIGSISKIITAVATLKLIEEGKLSLDSKAFEILNLPPEKDPSRRPEDRVNQITIRNLLEGSAGWDRSAQGDPMFVPIAQQAALEYSNSMRPTARAIIRYEACRRLDFNPGTRFSYSNLGYSILGEVIAKVTGMKYQDYVEKQILAPLGIRFQAGRTREVAKGEVHYYPCPGEPLGDCIAPNVRGLVPLEYGGDFYLEAMTADCGLIASTIEVAKFVSCLFGEQGKERQIISEKMVKLMVARPNLDGYWNDCDNYFAMGWEVLNSKYPKELMVKKEGSLPGVTATVVHTMDGSTLVIAINTRPRLSNDMEDELDELVFDTLNKRKSLWLQYRFNPNKEP